MKRVALLALLAACDQSAVVGSTHAAQQTIGAQGGVLAAPAADELAGTSLELPAGAFSADEKLTLDTGVATISDPPPAGPAVNLIPFIPLQRPAILTLPLRLMAGQSADDVFVIATDGAQHYAKFDHAALTVAGNQISFPITQLATYWPAAVLRCADVCSNGWTCINHECHP